MSEILLTKGTQFEVQLAPEAVALKYKALDGAKSITVVKDDFVQQVAVDVLKEIKTILKHVENSRSEAKKPALEFGRKIDSLAKTFCTELECESVRIANVVSSYEADKRKKAEEAEAARQAELRRQEEERRRMEEDERKKREAAERELAEAKSKKSREEAAARLKKQEEEAESRRKQLEAEQAAKATELAPKSFQKAEGSIVREVWTFTVTDLDALYAANKAMVRIEANASAINEKIRNGMRECPGLKIYKEINVGVRV